jgi:mannose-6-phosphate isomerase-like protein (cupin superfamily)
MADADATPRYDIRTDIAFGPLQLIDVGSLAAASAPWFNQSLCTVNDAVIRLGVLDGEFHWHSHRDEDEFFFVLSGRLHVDVRGDDGGEQSVSLGPAQGYLVPRGVVHRTRTEGRTELLMIEKSSVVPTGDA